MNGLEREGTPDVQDSDVQCLRKRILEMGYGNKSEMITTGLQGSSREAELASMVLRLTSARRPTFEQLYHQAATISSLMEQRDRLAMQASEVHELWEAERDGWSRIADALITKCEKKGEDGDGNNRQRTINVLESESYILKSRLHYTEARLNLLEVELSKLRPLLALYITPITSLNTPSSAKVPAAPGKDRSKAQEPEDDPMYRYTPLTPRPNMTYYRRPTTNGSLTSKPGPSSPSKFQAGMPSQPPNGVTSTSGLQTDDTPLPKPKRKRPMPTPILADARSEHLLLAAKKLGKARVEELASLERRTRERLYDNEARAERTRELARRETAAPKTPKRSKASKTQRQLVNTAQQHQLPLGYMVVPSPSDAPMLVPVSGAYFVPAPNSNGHAPYPVYGHPQPAFPPFYTNQPAGGSVHSHTPTTPLDSLLSAAQAARARVDEPDSPTPNIPPAKRRKLNGGGRTTTVGGSQSTAPQTPSVVGTPRTRMRSALDVLADQAASASVGEPSSTRGSREVETSASDANGETLPPELQELVGVQEETSAKSTPHMPQKPESSPHSPETRPLAQATSYGTAAWTLV